MVPELALSKDLFYHAPEELVIFLPVWTGHCLTDLPAPEDTGHIVAICNPQPLSPPKLIKQPHPLKPLSDVRAHELDFLQEAACSLSGVTLSVDHSSGRMLTRGGECPLVLRTEKVGD